MSIKLKYFHGLLLSILGFLGLFKYLTFLQFWVSRYESSVLFLSSFHISLLYLRRLWQHITLTNLIYCRQNKYCFSPSRIIYFFVISSSQDWDQRKLINCGKSAVNFIVQNLAIATRKSRKAYHFSTENLALLSFNKLFQSCSLLSLHSFDIQVSSFTLSGFLFLCSDGLISMVEFLTKHLQQIIDNKEVLIQRLHQPFVGEHLAIDSSHHE